jgi:glycogen debranching enzyme
MDFVLPEVFAGFPRQDCPFPIRYPTSSSPQAWAAAAPLLLLQTLLGLEPDPQQRTLRLRPLLPQECRHVHLRGVHAFGRRFDLSVEPGRADVVPTREGAAAQS